jgi:CDP-paratose 2-epimerase
MRILITGSSGLIGSEVCTYFDSLGWTVHGLDNNQRAVFFGPEGDTRWNQRRLETTLKHFTHHELDIRDRAGVFDLIGAIRPDALVHTAAQPSHDRAAAIPFDDFDTNAVGTLNLLEAIRRQAPQAPFVLLSTNKVYGDAPNRLNLREEARRWAYADPAWSDGIPETFPVDHSTHSLFGVSKLAADALTQEYGRYFGLKTCCLRGGCLTGPAHSGVELHGFLSYLVRCNLEGRRYTIYGYKGKQVRDNIHSLDVARFIEDFLEAPRCGEVYNIGGGWANSCSILEAFDRIEALSGRKMVSEYVEQPRIGDHICYYSDLSRIRSHYPQWTVTVPLERIFEEIHQGWKQRLDEPLAKVGANDDKVG